MTEPVTITIQGKTITAAREASVCVVYMGTVGEAELVHDAPFGCECTGQEWLMFEPGGSMVNAGLLAAHLTHPHPAFKRLLDAGAFTVYATAPEALGAPAKQVTDMVRVTRHAATLRAWLEVEEKREPKRLVLIAGLRERLRINELHSTPAISIASITSAVKPKGKAKAA